MGKAPTLGPEANFMPYPGGAVSAAPWRETLAGTGAFVL